MAKVSIIVPVYNSERYIGKCIDSLLTQTHEDIELILVDDCSKDHSYEIMKKRAHEEPRKIRLVKNPENKGAGASRNVGLDIANGDYIGFIDSDDYIDRDTVKKMHDALEKDDIDIARINRKIVYRNHDFSFLGRKLDVREDGIIVPKRELEYLTSDSPGVTNKLFTRELIDNRRFPEQLKWEDYPFSIPLMYQAKGVETVPDVFYYYTLNFSGTTVGDAAKVSPKLLDIFTCSDLIRKELPIEEDEELKSRIDFLCIQNCLQRVRDIFYSNLPLEEKKELINLISTLIKKKYGDWQTNPLYQEYKKSRLFYKTTIDLIEKYLLDDTYSSLDVPELEQQVQKVLTKKSQQ